MATDLPDDAYYQDPEDRSLQARFEQYHRDNPHLYRALEQMARQLHDLGRKRVGIELLFAELRWRSLISTTGDDYKLNNSYRSRYARLLLREHPEWEGLFELRRLHTPGEE